MSKPPRSSSIKGGFSENLFISKISNNWISGVKNLPVEYRHWAPIRTFASMFLKTKNKRVMWKVPSRLSKFGTFRGTGHLGIYLSVFRIWRSGIRSFRRFCLQLPIRGQRTRSNANTTRRCKFVEFAFWFLRNRMRRVHAGSVIGEGSKKKKIQAKMQAKRVGSKTGTPKKGPVRRTRDTKKSVWA